MSVFGELYSPKENRIEHRAAAEYKYCTECKHYSGHDYTCSKCTNDDLIRIAVGARKAESHIRETAKKYWGLLQIFTGKVAVLRHENNKLRKANEKLREQVKHD